MIQLPTEDFTFKYPEIIVLHFTVGFDHSNCGLRIEGNPDLDTEQTFTIQNAMLGGITFPELLIYCRVPPTTLLGYYQMRVCSAWVFQDWLRLYAFNADTIPHRFYGHSYHVAVLKEPRPDDSIVPLETLKRLQLVYEMYPEKRDLLRKNLGEEIEKWLEKDELKKAALKEVK